MKKNNFDTALYLFFYIFFISPFVFANTYNIVLTAFEPFGGRTTNNSISVATSLKAMLDRTYGNTVHTEICKLPVVYDQGALNAMRCILKQNQMPNLVISLGELSIGTDREGCHFQLDTSAQHMDDEKDLADNAGQVFRSRKIRAAYNEDIGFNLPVQEMYCASDKYIRGSLIVSSNAGGFVCNNVAYHLANFFKGFSVQYGLIHVPPHECGPEGDATAIAQILTQMIQKVWEYNEQTPARSTILPHITNVLRLPKNKEETRLLIQNIYALEKEKMRIRDDYRPCYLEFFDRLNRDYYNASQNAGSVKAK